MPKKQSFFGRLWRNIANAVLDNFELGGLVHFNTSPLIAPSSSNLQATSLFSTAGGGDSEHLSAE